MKKVFVLLLLVFGPIALSGAQTLGYPPTPMGAFIANNGTYTAWSSVLGSQTLGYSPTPIALYCSTNGTTWQPCNPGSGGSGTVSGQANGVIPLATSATGITAQSHFGDNGTNVTATLPMIFVNGTESAPAITFANSTAGGIYSPAAGQTAIVGSNNIGLALFGYINSGYIERLAGAGAISWSTGDPISSAGDVTLARNSAGTLVVGTSEGNLGGVTGTLKAANLVATVFTTTPVTVTWSASPALQATNGLQTITLTGNTTPTISGIAAGQHVSFQICQDATGGRTWTWPASVHGGMTIGSTLSTCSMQAFNSFNGTTLVAESTGVINVAP